MIHSLYCPAAGPRRADLSVAEIAQLLQEHNGPLWVSLEQPTPEESTAILYDTFHFHPLAIEDCQAGPYQVAKVDDYGDYVFIIAHAPQSGTSLSSLETVELDFFLGPGYLVTSFTEEVEPVREVWQRLERDERMTARGADFLCHAILDTLVDAYMPLIDALDEEIDVLEDQVLALPRTQTLQRILELKHSTLMLRRVIGPQREVMNRLSRDDFPQIDRTNRIYFRDIYDHLVRIQDLSESVRDIIGGALDTYLSATSNRLNQVMKALTIVSTIFLPLSFVASAYGMNFEFMPGLHWYWGFAVMCGIFTTMTLLMLWMFRHNDWL
jgi:magnesium transporter